MGFIPLFEQKTMTQFPAEALEQIAPTTSVKVEPFAERLKDDVDEVTEVASLGGGNLKSKLGTPDVVGTYKKLPGDLISCPSRLRRRRLKLFRQNSRLNA